jgi:large repetitive protein
MVFSNWAMSSGTWMNESIIAPDGSTVSQSSNQVSQNSFINPVTLPSTGTYTIDLNPQGGTGNVTMTAYDASDATAQVSIGGSPLTASIQTPGENELVQFAGPVRICGRGGRA